MRAIVTKPFGGHSEGDQINVPDRVAARWAAKGRIKPVGPDYVKPTGPRYHKVAKGGGWFVVIEGDREVYKGREAAVDRFIEEHS